MVEHLETVDEETELLHGVGGDHHDLAGVVPEAPGQGQLGEGGSKPVRDLGQSVSQLVPQSAKLCTKLRKGVIKIFLQDGLSQSFRSKILLFLYVFVPRKMEKITFYSKLLTFSFKNETFPYEW